MILGGYYYSPDEFYLLPALVASCGRCDDEECGRVHGFMVAFQFLWFGLWVAYEWGILIEDEDA